MTSTSTSVLTDIIVALVGSRPGIDPDVLFNHTVARGCRKQGTIIALDDYHSALASAERKYIEKVEFPVIPREIPTGEPTSRNGYFLRT